MNEKFLTADKLPRGVCGDSAGRQTGKKAETCLLYTSDAADEL